MSHQSPVFCDLHTHTIFSDGTYTPPALVAAAARIGLGAIALTDHNTVAGLPDFLRAARERSVTPVSGVELSTEYTTVRGREVELHILGLFLPEASFPAVTEFTEDYARRKAAATRAMVDALKADGYRVDYDTLCAATPNGNINRAHVAAALIREGQVPDRRTAFSTLLAMNGAYYTPPRRPTAAEAIDFLLSIHALPVLAHPYLSMRPDEVEGFLPEAKAQGLRGMETRYDLYDEPTTALAMETAARFDLLESGGSDFHGEVKPGVELGVGHGQLHVPMEVFDRLAAAARDGGASSDH